MFDLFRSRDKLVRIMLGGLLLVVAMSMLTYLVPSYGTGAGGASDVVVAEIDKDTITLPEVQQEVQMQLRGKHLPPEIMPHYVPQFIDQMITERALAYEAVRLGFKISDDELANAIRQTIPQLFQDGKFAGKEMYTALLAQQNMTIPQFEDEVKRQLLVSKLRNVAMEGIIVTPQEIEQEYKKRNDKVKIEYVKIAQDKLKSEVNVTPEEVRKYYNEHSDLYRVPEKRDLGIVIIDQAKLEAAIQPTDADLLRAYNENKDNYRTPERVNIRHILIKADAKDAKAQAAAKTKIEGLLKQARTSGTDFAELAKKNSEDPGSAAKGGEYDGVVRGQMVPEFEKAAFALKPGEISDPVKTEYGFHIIKLISHEQANLKPFSEVKDQLALEFKKQRVNDTMQQLSDKVQAALAKDPTHPDKVAADLGAQYVVASRVGTTDPLPEVGVNKEFQQAVEAIKKGEVSQPVMVAGNKIAFGVCTEIYPAHPSDFADVQDKVRDIAINDKATHQVDEKANQLLDKVKANGGDLEAAAKSMGLEMKTSDAVNRNMAIEGLGSASMMPDAFTKPAGSVFGPIPVSGGKAIGKVIEKLPSDMSGLVAQRTVIRDQIKGQKSQSRQSLFEEGVRDALKQDGKVKIHQDVINRLLAGYTRT